MKHGTIKSLLGGVIVAGFSLGAYAELKDNPYQVIIERNPFGLRPIPPPPPPPQAEAPPAPPPPDIKLTGIHTLLGPPKVFLEFTDAQTKKVDRPSALLEGESFKDVTVLSIDPENGIVKVRIGDKEISLDFEHNGIKPSGMAAAAPAVPGVVPINPAGMPQPPGGFNSFQPGNTGGRSVIMGGASAGTAPGASPYGVGASAGLGGLPQRAVRTESLGIVAGGNQPYNPNPTPQPAFQPTLTRDEAEARIEAQRAILLQQKNSAAVLLPPTRLGGFITPPPAPGRP